MVPVWCVCLCAANKQSFSPVQSRVSEKMSWEQCKIIIFIWDNSFRSWLYFGILSLFIRKIYFFGLYGRYLQKTWPTVLNSFCSNSSATMIPWYIVLKPCLRAHVFWFLHTCVFPINFFSVFFTIIKLWMPLKSIVKRQMHKVWTVCIPSESCLLFCDFT